MMRRAVLRAAAAAACAGGGGGSGSSTVAVAAAAATQHHQQQQQQLMCSAAALYVLHSGGIQRQRWRGFASSSSSGSGSGDVAGPPSTSGSGDAADKLASMMDVLMSNPSMQQLLLSRMPPHMRRPEVLRAMMANPEVRQRIAALAQQTGLDKTLAQLDPALMAAGVDASGRAGLDPSELFERFSQNPTLAPRMGDPRVLAALMDMASNGADALKKYSGDADVVEAAMEAGAVIEQMQAERLRQQQQPGGSSSSSGGGAGGGGGAAAAAAEAGGAAAGPRGLPGDDPRLAADAAAVQAQLGASPAELMARLAARPELMARMQDPEVRSALADVAASPWRVVKYIFKPKILAALRDMKNLLDEKKQ